MTNNNIRNFGAKCVTLCLALIISIVSCKQTKQSKNQKPKNVIFCIGDGMGLAQVSSTLFFNNGKESAFKRFPVVGLHIPKSAKQKITDSAAGATAFATGKKTYNGAVSKDTLQHNIETIFEHISVQDISTGLIVTSSITHATPACFYAHANSRHDHQLIAEQLINSNIDFIAGGGLKYFNQNNLLEELKSSFELSTSIKPMELDPNNKYAFILAEDGLKSALKGRGTYLSDMSLKALNFLKKKENPFIAVIESSQIDWEGHSANHRGIVAEMNDFNSTLNSILNWAEDDGETLVIVTADHETGGYAITPQWNNLSWDYDSLGGSFYNGVKEKESTLSHTGTMVPIFAFGPGANVFTGIYQNTDIHRKLLELTEW